MCILDQEVCQVFKASAAASVHETSIKRAIVPRFLGYISDAAFIRGGIVPIKALKLNQEFCCKNGAVGFTSESVITAVIPAWKRVSVFFLFFQLHVVGIFLLPVESSFLQAGLGIIKTPWIVSGWLKLNQDTLSKFRLKGLDKSFFSPYFTFVLMNWRLSPPTVV